MSYVVNVGEIQILRDHIACVKLNIRRRQIAIRGLEKHLLELYEKLYEVEKQKEN